MSLEINIEFTSPEKDAEFWEQLLAGLCKEKRGAWLEEQFEQFGEEAASLIVELMDNCEEMSYGVSFDYYERKGNTFKTLMFAEFGIIEDLPNIRTLLLMCDVKNLHIDEPDEDELNLPQFNGYL